MARWEMGDADIGSMGRTQPSAKDLFDLGIMFSSGLGVETDLIAAHKWFNLAAATGDNEATQYRREVAREMSEADIAEAQRAAREWLRAH